MPLCPPVRLRDEDMLRGQARAHSDPGVAVHRMSPLRRSVSMILVKIEDLQMYFSVKGGLLSRSRSYVRAVDGVSFEIEKGETLGLVGESGSGKTTVGKLLMKILKPTGGKIYFGGLDISNPGRKEMKGLRTKMQMVFQNPYSSLNP